MIHRKLLRQVPVVLALAASGLALNAMAQGASPTGPGSTTPQKAGESYPNDPNAAMKKPTPEVVQKVEKSRPAQATKRVAKKTGNVVSDGAKATQGAIANTGDKIAKKLPPAKNPSEVNAQGTAKVAP